MRHHASLVHLAVLITSLLPVSAQSQTPPSLHFKRIGVEQGLSASWVQCLGRDRDGFVWIGTENGANRFDGAQFSHYGNVPFDTTSLPSGYANAIVQDSTGAMWIATSKGLSRRDPATNQWQRVQQDTTLPRTQTLPSNGIISLICARDGTLWFGTDKGLCRFQGFQRVSNRPRAIFSTITATANENITVIFQDRHNPHILWLGTYNRQLVRYDTRTNTTEKYTPAVAYLPVVQYGNQIVSIVQDANCTLWIACDNRSLLAFSPERKQWRQFLNKPSTTNSLSHNRVQTLALEEAAGYLWVGTWGGGLCRFDLRTETFTTWKHNPLDPTTLTHDMIGALMFDREGNLWCGTAFGVSLLTTQARRTGGFRTFAHDPNHPIDQHTLPDPAVACVVTDQQRRGICVGTLSGIAWFDAVTNRIQRVSIRIPRRHDSQRAKAISCSAVDKAGNVWAGTSDGLYVARENSLMKPAYTKPSSAKPLFTFFAGIKEIQQGAFLRGLWCDSEGILWISDNNAGLVIFNPTTGTYTIPVGKDLSAFRGFIPTRPLSFAERVNVHGEREVWFGGLGGGLQCYNTVTKRFRGYQHDLGNPRSLPTQNIGCVFVRQMTKGNGTRHDEIWFSPMNAGLCRLTNPDDTSNPAFFERFTEADGIPQGTIWGIAEHKGSLWCASQRGILQYSPEQHTTHLFGRADGLPTLEFLGCSRLHDGRMFFASTNGLVTFHPDSFDTKLPPPRVMLTNFTVLSTPVALTSQQQRGAEAIRVRWEENIVRFAFAAPTFAAQEQTQYRYRLDGFDTDWRKNDAVESSNEAMYNNLNAGEYVFRAQASFPDGTWNEAGEARVQLVVVPPFWRTQWFVGTALVLAIMGFALSVRWLVTLRLRRRISMLEELNRERDRISQDVHDDVGSTLTRVALLAEALKYNPTGNQVQHRLDTIATVAREATSTLSEIIWAIKPVHDSLENFFAYTREYAMELFEDTEMRCVVEIPSVIPLVSLLPEVRRNAFLIVKESLNNAAKHSGAMAVRLVFFLNTDELEIRIIDDGNGFDVERVQRGTSNTNGGNGLGNIRRRVERLGGKYVIESKVGEGTRVMAKIPLQT